MGTIGLLLGCVYWLISQIIYFVFLSPLLIGALAGAFLGEAARKIRFNHFRLALAAAITMAGILYVTYQGVQAIYYQPTVFNAAGGFANYAAWFMRQPTVIAQAFTLRFSVPSPPGFVLGASIFELGTIGLVASFVVKRAVEAPFCRYCRCWYSGRHIGSIMDYDAPIMIEHMEQRDLYCVAQLLEPDVATNHGFDVYLSTCGCGRSPALLTVSWLSVRQFGRPQQHDLVRVKLVPGEISIFSDRLHQ